MPLKDNYDTFMSHETWWNEFRMTLKMYKNVCIILLTVDLFLVGLLLDLDKNKSGTLFTIAKNSFEATVKWFGSPRPHPWRRRGFLIEVLPQQRFESNSVALILPRTGESSPVTH